ncbi:hypothetical protein BB559_000344 [Furculomyces boomerangus]|uniref:AB hydrolase-1 domain-containing protein n=2 Tax=Harpellales TaxID=61421 RepID=A0A2T9Z5L0_9FUNG|nr:hypothetical protein BB559_000344 [Furculomyces boomerangus]PWA01668.1 hypothetical protein BB558_002219 [Smittium angustum]
MNRTIIKNLISTNQAFSGHLDIPRTNGSKMKTGKLYIEDSGETQDTKGVLVCFPGIGDVRTSFRFLVDTFVPEGYRVIIADIRGMGDSWEGFNEFTPESVATDISEVIKQRKLTQNVILIGNSLSAGSCILSAAQHSNIVKGVIMLGPIIHDLPADKYFRPISHLLFNRIWGSTLWSGYYSGLYKRDTKPTGYENHLNDIKKSLRKSKVIGSVGKFIRAPKNGVENSIPNLTCPTIAIYGDQDPDFSDVPKEKEWLLNKTKGHRNVDAFILEKVGHYPHVEAFDETKSIIEQFLNRILE